MTVNAEEVLEFWFPRDLGVEPDQVAAQVQWWFRGGSNAQVQARFGRTLELAERGDLAAWLSSARSRLALIIVLDQFSRSIYQISARAYANDPAALAIAEEGLEVGHYAELTSAWERTFFSLPFGHSENLKHARRAVDLADEVAANAPPGSKQILAFSAQQARGHRDVIAQFGRHPHRNQVLGRKSTTAELAYLETGDLVHQRTIPGATT